MSLRILPVLLLCAVFGRSAEPALAAAPVDGVFSASNGLSGGYRLLVPDGLEGAGSLGLLLFFHADGDVDSFRTHAGNLAERGAKSRLAVAALAVPRPGPADGTPPSDPADQCWWAPREASNARYVGEWIEGVAAAELGDVLDPERVYFAGVSGGADFASALHLHLGFRYGGGSVALCGGDLPRADGGSCLAEPGPPVLDPLPAPAELPQGAAEAASYSFDLTKDDSLRPLALAARDYYEELGFRAWFGTPAGSGHCGFDETLELLLDKRIERAAAFAPGCSPLDLSGPGAGLLDEVPLQVADQAIPAGDPARAGLLESIQTELAAIEALRAAIPDDVDLCGARSDCPDLDLRATKRELRRHLARLKRKLVPQALARSSDRALRDALREANRASHRAKKASLKQIPSRAQLCEL
jgi:hypothetical protein